MNLTPDGFRYLHLARGERIAAPFHFRWLVPKFCTTHPKRWVAVAVGSVVLTAVGTGLLADGWKQGLAAGLMMAALPISRFNLRHPVLVDAPAMACAVLAAVAVQEGLWPLGLLMTLAAGSIKETAPVFAAIYAWHPVLLVGLLAPALRGLARRGSDVLDEENAWILDHPVKASLKYHKGQWLDGEQMLSPWGGALVALVAIDWRLGLLLAVAYAQLLVATDTVRLYQWAGPIMCVVAVSTVPVAWLPLLVAVTVWNPLGGDGL